MIESHSSLSEKFLKKWFWLYFFTFLMAPTGYIIKIIISGNVSVEELGILYWVISLITLVSALNDFWVSQSMNYFIPKYIEENNYHKVKSIIIFWLSVQFITSLIFLSLFLFWAEFIWENYFKSSDATEVIQVFSIFFLGINIFQTLWTFFMSVQNTFLNKWIEFIRMFATLSIVWVIWYLGASNILFFSYAWLCWLYVWVLFSVIIFVRNYYCTYLKWSHIIKEISFYKEVSLYSAFLFLWSQVTVILSQLDMQMIIYFMWSAGAWYYTNYLSLIGIPFIVIYPIMQFLNPVFADMHAKKDYKTIGKIRTTSTEILTITGIYIIGFFTVFYKQLAYLFFWEAFLISWEILLYSVPFIIFVLLLQLNFVIFSGTGRVKERFKIISIGILINFVLNIILIQKMWIYGAALATGIGWSFIYILTEIKLHSSFPLKISFSMILKNIFWVCWVTTSIYILLQIVQLNSTRLQSFSILSVGFILYLSLFIFINQKKMRMFFQEIKKLKTKTTLWKK